MKGVSFLTNVYSIPKYVRRCNCFGIDYRGISDADHADRVKGQRWHFRLCHGHEHCENILTHTKITFTKIPMDRSVRVSSHCSFMKRTQNFVFIYFVFVAWTMSEYRNRRKILWVSIKWIIIIINNKIILCRVDIETYSMANCIRIYWLCRMNDDDAVIVSAFGCPMVTGESAAQTKANTVQCSKGNPKTVNCV